MIGQAPIGAVGIGQWQHIASVAFTCPAQRLNWVLFDDRIERQAAQHRFVFVPFADRFGAP